MAKIRKIFRYMKHYGAKSTVGLIKEKLLIDPKRFSAKKERTLPDFPTEYKKGVLPRPSRAETSKDNILYLIHYFYPAKKGGTERFTLNLAKELIKQGNNATVLVLEANESASIYTDECGDILYRRYSYDGIDCIAFRHKRAPLGIYYKSINLDDEAMRAFARHITEKLGITVVHATYPQPFASFLDECKTISIPYIVTCTDFCMMCHYSTMVDKNGDFCNGTKGQTKCARVCSTYGCKDFHERHENARKVLLGAKAVTVPSEFVARVLGNEFPDVAFLPVAHGISDAFSYNPRCGRVKKFVYAGTLSQLKGVHLLISAFTSLDGDITLNIYGDGDETYLKKLRELADERVSFKGAAPASSMPSIYSNADCVIVPSMWYETYNFVLREALMTGALVLASNIGAMPEAIDVGENGYLFAPADLDDLKEKMKSALSFDFQNYKKREFPATEDEGRMYSGIYEMAKKA